MFLCSLSYFLMAGQYHRFPSFGHFRHEGTSVYLLTFDYTLYIDYTFDLYDSSFHPPNKRPAGTACRQG